MGYYNDLTLGDTYTADDEWYDRKDYGRAQPPAAPRTPVSDLRIPRTCDILDRACDLLGSAYRLQDDSGARQLERLITNLPGAALCWQLGTLIVRSPSEHTYRVTRAGCDCPNGQKCGKRQCWHVATFELLLDMFDTECESADMAADPPGDNPLGDDEGDSLPDAGRPWQIGAVMGRQLLHTRLAATGRYVEALRGEQACQQPAHEAERPLRVRLVAARQRSPYFLSAFYLSRAA
jgi:hypothetical protein